MADDYINDYAEAVEEINTVAEGGVEGLMAVAQAMRAAGMAGDKLASTEKEIIKRSQKKYKEELAAIAVLEKRGGEVGKKQAVE